MKMLKIALASLAVLIVLGIISLAIDYYFYSWTSYVRPFGCEYKSIRVTYGNENLNQEYNLIQIGTEIKSNPNYQFESWNNEQRLIVSRLFGEVRYGIAIEKKTTSDGQFASVRFWNKSADSASVRHGESAVTPDYQIKKNIHQMIDELPLNNDQKKNLEEKVTITCSPSTRFSF
jgi:hypothetical protein